MILQSLSMFLVCGALAAQPSNHLPPLVPLDNGAESSAMFFCHGGYLGVQIEDVDASKKADLGLSDEYGAAIDKVVDNSPAAKAGLQEKDVIVGWNGTRVESVMQLTRLIHETPSGRTVHLDVVRNGSPITIDAELGSAPAAEFNFNMPHIGLDSMMAMELGNGGKCFKFRFDGADKMKLDSLHRQLEKLQLLGDDFEAFGKDMEAMGEGFSHSFRIGRPRLGIETQSISPALAKYFGVQEGRGALISNIIENTPAQKSGLQAGDVIISIDGEKVNSPGDVSRIIREKNEGEVAIRIMRERQEQTIRAALEPTKSDGTNEPFRMFENAPNPKIH